MSRPVQEPPRVATCIRVGVYEAGLTYGGTYLVLASDPGKRQIKVRGDNGRTRWYPNYCFDTDGRPCASWR